MTKKKDFSQTAIELHYTPGPTVRLGYLPNDKVYDYLEKLKKSVSTSDRCTYYNFKLLVYPDARYQEKKLITVQTLVISANPYSVKTLCKTRTLDGCLRKIKNHTCPSRFIIDATEEFFQNNKQR